MPQTPVTIVTHTRPVEPALHIARYGFGESGGRRATDTVLVPRRADSAVSEVMHWGLQLPSSMFDELQYLHPSIPGPIFALPHMPDPQTGLLLSFPALEERWIRRSWRTQLLVTPSSVGVPIAGPVLTRVALSLLAKVPAELVTQVLANLAVESEVNGCASDEMRRSILRMKLPEPYKQRLYNSVATGQPWLDPRCARWLIREILAAQAAGLSALTAIAKARTDHDYYAEMAFFPQAFQSKAVVTWGDIITAIWFAHEGYLVGERARLPIEGSSEPLGSVDREEPMESYGLIISGALQYGRRNPGQWLDQLDRWDDILSTPATHPVVTNRGPCNPDRFRAEFAYAAGLAVGEWIAAGAVLTVLYGQRAQQRHTAVALEGDFLPLPNSPLIAAFHDVLDDYVVDDVAIFGQQLVVEAESYGGLGTLPNHETKTFKEKPLIRLADGATVLVGIDLLAERICEVPKAMAIDKQLFGKTPTSVENLMGYMFEAYTADLMASLDQQRHLFLSETDVKPPGSSSYADGAIASGWSYLSVETSIQTLPVRLASGAPARVRTRLDSYLKELDQARCTTSYLPTVAAKKGLAAPKQCFELVVTDISLSLTPALAAELRRKRPGVNPKFFCSVEEFEKLLALGEVGFSIPSLIASWQASPLDLPLGPHLHDMWQMRGYPKLRESDWRELLSRLGLSDEGDAAA